MKYISLFVLTFAIVNNSHAWQRYGTNPASLVKDGFALINVAVTPRGHVLTHWTTKDRKTVVRCLEKENTNNRGSLSYQRAECVKVGN